MLVNPNYVGVELQTREIQDAASTVKQAIDIVSAGTESDVDAAFATLDLSLKSAP